MILGWGDTKDKYYGVLYVGSCDHCNNEVEWQLHETCSWFSLFFIPVIPYERKYLVLCPICNWGSKLTPLGFKQAKRKVELNNSLLEGKISSEEHQDKAQVLSNLEKREKRGEIRFEKKVF